MSTAEALAVQKNPFPGLRPFREDEEYVFFGRESQVDAMVDKLADTHFLAVVGTSGSGKSSLVNCGLRPALHRGLMARAGTAWRMAQFRPGSDPLGAMARALAQDGVLFRDYAAGGLTLAEIVDTTLRMSKLGLIDIYEQARLGEDVNLLVVVDQFEELFRYRQLGAAQHEDVSGISEAATAFVNLLLEAKAQTTYPIYVVLTMRSDFLGDCAQFPGLAEAINAGQYLVPRMTRDERRAAISGPVGVGGAEVAPVLLTRLVNDVGDNPDQLSILQHALNRTWACWQHKGGGKGLLDLKHYDAIGAMAHALDQHAEKAYAGLGTARQRQICGKLFKALTDKATDPRGVRRPTTLGTLCALADATEAEVTEVIDVFRQPSRSFLMPPAGDVLETETVIDISHESLMRVWQRLNTWADEEAQSAQIYRRLAETSVLHREGRAGLWQDPDLQLTLTWREHNQPNEVWTRRYHPEFAGAMRFLEKSRAARERKRWTRIGLTLAVIVVLAGFLGYALWQANEADKRAITAEATLRWSPFDLDGGLSKRESEGLLALARGEKAVKIAFAKYLKEDDALADKFSMQPKAITRALAGLDTVARDWLIQELLVTPMPKETKPAARAALGLLAAELEAASAIDKLVAAIQATIQATADPFQLEALVAALAALPVELTPSQAASAVDKLVAAIQATNNSYQLRALVEALAALATKLTLAQAEPFVNRLVAAIQNTTDSYQLEALVAALAALPVELTPSQAASAVDKLVAAIQATNNSYQLRALVEALAALATKLTLAQAEPFVNWLVAAIQNAYPDELEALVAALAALPVELTPSQAASAVDKLVAAIQAANNSYQLRALVEALAALAAKVPPSQAASAVDKLVAAIQAANNSYQLRALVEALAALATKLTLAQAEPFVNRLVAAIQNTTDSYQLEALVAALAALPVELTPSQAASAVDKLVAAIQAANDFDQLEALGKALAALAAKVPPSQAEPFVNRLVAAIQNTTDSYQLEALVAALAALPVELTPSQAASAVDKLVAAIQAANDFDQLEALVAALAALPVELTPSQAASAVDKLVAAIQATNNSYQLRALVEALAALATKLTLAQAEPFVNWLVAAIQNAYPDELEALVAALAALPVELSPSQAASAVDKLVAAIQAANDFDQLEALGKALAALAAKVPPSQAEPFVNRLVADIKNTTDSYQLEALVAALAALPVELPPSQAASAVDKLVAAIQAATDTYQLGALGNALAALAAKLTPAQAASAVDKLVIAIQATAAKLPPSQAEPFVDRLVADIKNTTEPGKLGELVEALATQAARMTPAQAASAVGKLVTAIQATSDPDQLKAMGAALTALVKPLKALATKLTPGQAKPAVGKLNVGGAIQAATDPDQFGALVKPLATLAPKLSDDWAFASLVFKILKYPNLANVRSAEYNILIEDILLEAVRTRFKTREPPAKEKGFWAMVKWAKKQFPGLDLKSPPKVVSK